MSQGYEEKIGETHHPLDLGRRCRPPNARTTVLQALSDNGAGGGTEFVVLRVST